MPDVTDYLDPNCGLIEFHQLHYILKVVHVSLQFKVSIYALPER